MARWTAITILSIFFLLGNYNFKDVTDALSYYGELISPSYPGLGALTFVLIILYILFTEEINNLIRKSRILKMRINTKI